MAEDISGWCSFKEIVDSANIAEGDSADMGQFMRKLDFAIECYVDELRMHVLPAAQSVKLHISPEIRAIAKPGDFMKFKSVGVLHKGHFHKFLPKYTVDYTEMECGIDERETDNHASKHHRNYGFYTLEPKRILIDADLTVQEVILNYTPTGISRDGSTLVPRMCKKVIKAYIEQEMAVHDKVTAYDKETFQKRYERELQKFIGLQYDTDALWMIYYEHLANNYKY
jgi:hypothetical protein